MKLRRYRQWKILFILIIVTWSCSDENQPTSSNNSDDQPIVETHWITRPEMLTPRQELTPVSLNSLIYVIGGMTSDHRQSSIAERYDPKSMQWSILSELPEPRHHITLTEFNGRLYAIGGLTGRVNTRPHNDVFVYDPVIDTWEIATNLPVSVGAHSAAAYGENIFLFGGWGTSTIFLDSTWMFNPESNIWSERPPMPTARNHSVAVVLDSLIFVMGGRIIDRGSTINVKTNEAYSPASNAWYTFADLPNARSGHSIGVHDGKIYLFGGEYFASGGGIYSSVWEYNPALDTWLEISTMQTPRHGTAAVRVADTLFIIGGADEPLLSTVGTNEGFVFE
jgi:N-acetylneuraminic acid mutarotase